MCVLSAVEQRRLGVLRAARALVAPWSDVAEVTNAAAEVLSDVLGGGCVIRLASADRAWLDAVAIRCADPDHQRFVEAIVTSAGRQPSDAGVNGAVFASGQPLVMGELDVEEYRLLLQPEFWPVLDRYRVVSTIAVPLRGEHEMLGTLTMAHFDESPSLSADGPAFVKDLARIVATSIDRARRAERGDGDGRVRRVSMSSEQGAERLYLVWADGRTYSSGWPATRALLSFVSDSDWESAITDPADAFAVFSAAFSMLGLTPEVRLA